MKSNNIFTSILVFICFALYVKIELTPECKENGKEYTVINQQLQAENDSLKQNNKVLDEKYTGLKERADSLQQRVSVINKAIVQLKQQQYEKINAIDNLTNGELYSFFSNFNTENKHTK
ncbi:MAG: hypothetical protein HY062_14830 [Bacteroidetes bacterium]|nr:hypothetical protein [Bacteroidota bacterium]